MSNVYLDSIELRQQIDALLIQFPELAEDEILRADTFEAETNFNAILEKLVGMAGDAGAMVEAIKVRSSALHDRRKRFERREEAMRIMIQKIMERGDLKKLTLPEATLSLSFRKPSIIVTDETALPDEFCRFVRLPDMKKINEAATLPAGCSMSNGKTVLAVRTK